MENRYWKGQVDQQLEFNDKEHGRIFDAVKEFGVRNEKEHENICRDIMGLKIRAARSGSKWGAITAAVTSALMIFAAWILNKFFV